MILLSKYMSYQLNYSQNARNAWSQWLKLKDWAWFISSASVDTNGKTIFLSKSMPKWFSMSWLEDKHLASTSQ
jgi:hypothetical protein